MEPSVHNQLLDAIREYTDAPVSAQLLTENLPLVIAGITAAGKDVAIDYIQQTSEWRLVITHTTRSPRHGEKSGEHYWFVDEPEMLRLLSAHSFIEAKLVHGEHVYGTSVASYQTVIEQRHKPILRIDIQGIEEISKLAPGIRPIFVLPPNFDTWIERLNRRGSMSHVERSLRLRSARIELEEVLGNEKFRLVVNRDVPSMAKEILGGVTDAPTQKHNREVAQTLIEHIRKY